MGSVKLDRTNRGKINHGIGSPSAAIRGNVYLDDSESGGVWFRKDGGSWEWYDSPTGETLDVAYDASGGASLITMDAGDVTWAPTGAYSFIVDLTATTGSSTDGFLVENGADYFRVKYAGAGDINFDAAVKGFNVDATGTISFNAINIDTTSNVTNMGTLGCGAITSTGTLDLAANSITMTGSIATTGSRVTKGWFTDLECTNAITGSITGNAATVTVADTASATCYVGLYEAASGSLAGKTDAALTYNASTGALAATSMGVATGGAFTYNSAAALSAITAKNDWNLCGGGNLSMTAEQCVCIGPSAGAAISTTGYSVHVGYSAGSSVVGLYGNNVIVGCIASRDAASIKNSVVSGYAAGIGMNGDYDIAIGTSAGRYYGAGTDQNLSATQCVYLGGLSRASASGNTNEIVIGYNAIGAGSNTATLGNTSITQTQLRGNFGTLVTYGTSAAKVLGLASGTAPTTSPADAVQIYAADFNAAAGTAALHIRSEDGFRSVFGNNWGLFTAGAEVIDASAEKTIFLSNGTAPDAHTDDGTYIYSQDCGGSYNSGLASAAFYSEEPVAAIGSYAPDRVWPITINGLTYLMFLQSCNLT